MLAISFHQLQAFHAVARRLSYSRAAEQLYISQPAVSRMVQDLEKAVGAPVFHRQGRHISLTDAGRRLYDYAERVFDLTDELEQAVQELQDVTRGRLRLAASSTTGIYVLPAFLGAFQRRNPEIEVSLRVCNSSQAALAVQQGEAQLGFVSMPVEAPGLQWQTLFDDEMVFIAPPGHPLAGRRATAGELCQETLLVREEGSGTRRYVEREFERLGKKPRRLLEMSSTEAIIRAVAAGLGVSAIPTRALAGDRPPAGIETLSVEGLDLHRPLGMLTRKGARVPPVALAFAAALLKAGVSPVTSQSSSRDSVDSVALPLIEQGPT